MTPKHKQRQGYHTMSHQDGEYCIVCSATNEVERMLSSTSASTENNNFVNNLTLGFSGMALSNQPAIATPAVNLKYNPAVGIYSILNA